MWRERQRTEGSFDIGRKIIDSAKIKKDSFSIKFMHVVQWGTHMDRIWLKRSYFVFLSYLFPAVEIPV